MAIIKIIIINIVIVRNHGRKKKLLPIQNDNNHDQHNHDNNNTDSSNNSNHNDENDDRAHIRVEDLFDAIGG